MYNMVVKGYDVVVTKHDGYLTARVVNIPGAIAKGQTEKEIEAQLIEAIEYYLEVEEQ